MFVLVLEADGSDFVKQEFGVEANCKHFFRVDF